MTLLKTSFFQSGSSCYLSFAYELRVPLSTEMLQPPVSLAKSMAINNWTLPTVTPHRLFQRLKKFETFLNWRGLQRLLRRWTRLFSLPQGDALSIDFYWLQKMDCCLRWRKIGNIGKENCWQSDSVLASWCCQVNNGERGLPPGLQLIKMDIGSAKH